MRKREEHLRMCAGCRQLKPKSAMLRIALLQDGARVDYAGKADGRGVYVCRSGPCIEKMYKCRKSRLAGGNAIPDSVFEELQEVLTRE